MPALAREYDRITHQQAAGHLRTDARDKGSKFALYDDFMKRIHKRFGPRAERELVAYLDSRVFVLGNGRKAVDVRAHLPLVEFTEGGQSFATGRPVTMRYMRNLAPAAKTPKGSDPFQQSIEPAGRYMLHQADSHTPQGWSTGEVTFKSPLVLLWGNSGTYDGESWKARLAQLFGAKGRSLSSKIAAAGFDGIVTVDNVRGQLMSSEIVDLTMFAPTALGNGRVLTGDIAPDGTIGRLVKGPDGKRRRVREQLTPAELAAPDWRKVRATQPPRAPTPEPEAPVAVAPDPEPVREFNPGSIPMDLAVRAHAGTSFVPERRGQQAVDEYVRVLAGIWDRIKAKCRAPEEEAIALEAMERFKQRYRNAYTARLGAQSRIVSWMIAGPSKFPVRQMEKRNATDAKRLGELVDLQEGGEAWVWKHVQDYRKVQELEKAGSKGNLYRQKAEKLQALQALMVSANKIVRSKATAEQKIDQLIELGVSADQAHQLIHQPDYLGRYGFADYQLTNNGAEIRRLLKQAEAEDAKSATPTSSQDYENGIQIVDNAEADRLQILFPGKPDEATRTALKSHGFRWSPTEGAWQRQRSNQAIYWAQQIVGNLSAKANWPRHKGLQ